MSASEPRFKLNRRASVAAMQERVRKIDEISHDMMSRTRIFAENNESGRRLWRGKAGFRFKREAATGFNRLTGCCIIPQ